MSQTLFLSTVTAEFGPLRKRIAEFLERTKRVRVRFQEDFFHSSLKTLRILEEQVAASDTVVHVIGQEPGWCPPIDEVEDFLTRHPEFATRLPAIIDTANAGMISATQWEVWLAMFFNIEDVLIYEFTDRLLPDSSQAIHSARLRSWTYLKSVATEDELWEEIIGSVLKLGQPEQTGPDEIAAQAEARPDRTIRIVLPEPHRGTSSEKLPLMNSPELARQRQLELCSQLSLPWATQHYSGIDFQIIPSGRFLMGASVSDRSADPDEHPQTIAEISRPLLVSKHPVSCATVRELLSQMQITKSWHDWILDTEDRDGALPAVELNAFEIQEICEELSRNLGIRCRLPTEVEWEYFARAGATTPFWWGKDFNAEKAVLNSQRPSTPADHRCNSWGLCDMLGNVAEWTSSRFGSLDSELPGQACTAEQSAGYCRAVRGGSFRDNDPSEVRLSARRRIDSSVKAIFIGFRIVLDFPSEASHEKL